MRPPIDSEAPPCTNDTSILEGISELVEPLNERRMSWRRGNMLNMFRETLEVHIPYKRVVPLAVITFFSCFIGILPNQTHQRCHFICFSDFVQKAI